MKIKDILQRDPAAHPLVNQGQARIADEQDQALEELRGELSLFVCEGQYADGIQKILRSFIDNLSKTSQRGAWISGFFGSGKSHLLKMLCHLCKDTAFPDGSTARSLVPALPEELRFLLRELDAAGGRYGGVIAAAGTLPGGTTENVRLTILGVLLRAMGLPESYQQASFCLWLKSNEHYDKVKAHIQAAGRDFEQELSKLYVSGPLMRALLACDHEFAVNEAQAKQQIKAQFPPQSTDITTAQFLTTAREALKLTGRDGRMPCVLLLLDEVQLYIGDSNERSVLVAEVAEAVSKQLESRVMLVCAGRSALTDEPLLRKLMDRFTIRVPLSDREVETVTRKVLLQKKPDAIAEIRKLVDMHAGEVARQLKDTHIGPMREDEQVIVDDYPLLPVRRRFWEQCFRQIDAAGTSSQLRSQLRIIHDAVARLSDKPLSAVVPADELYDALAPEMVSTGVLLREINQRILQVGRAEGELARRLCGLVFLIGKLKREGGEDIGVRASKDHMADLLVSDLAADNEKLRSDVETILKRLTDQGVLMLVGDEYRLQTQEGAEWEREFRDRQARLGTNAASIRFLKDQLLYAEAERIISAQCLTQGAAKQQRQLQMQRGPTAPAAEGSGVPVWVKDGWSSEQKDAEETARKAGTDSPIIYMFIGKHAAEDLKRCIVEAEAAGLVLEAMGTPNNGEGRDARGNMESRLMRAEAERERLIHEIVSKAKVYQGGGNEVSRGSLEKKLKTVAAHAVVRLFPRFKDADYSVWETVVKRARDGTDHPFQPVGRTEATEKHAVCQQVITSIGSGKSGAEVRRMLHASPYGWPEDAIDAALITLHRSQHIKATHAGSTVPPGQLDLHKIDDAEFHAESITLSASDRLRLRELFQAVGLACKNGEEAIRAGVFLDSMLGLAQAAGGEPPLPVRPSTSEIRELKRLAGNEQLMALKDQATELEAKIQAWQAACELSAARTSAWAMLEKLAYHAAGVTAADGVLVRVIAIRGQRVLPGQPDFVIPLVRELAQVLRDASLATATAHRDAYAASLANLESNAVWNRLYATDRTGILSAVGLTALVAADVSTDERLLELLERSGLAMLRAECDAIPGRLAQAIVRAAKLLEPEVQTVGLERVTLRSEAELDAWLARQRSKLVSGLEHSPVLVG